MKGEVVLYVEHANKRCTRVVRTELGRGARWDVEISEGRDATGEIRWMPLARWSDGEEIGDDEDYLVIMLAKALRGGAGMSGPPTGEELRKQYRAMHRRAQEAEAELARWKPKVARRDHGDGFIVVQLGLSREVLLACKDPKAFVRMEIESMLLSAVEEAMNGAI